MTRMNSDYEKRLETAIDKELGALPELPAPATLAPRVLTALAPRASLSWYRQPWMAWPVALRAGSFAFLVAVFAGICLAGAQVGQTQALMRAVHRLDTGFSAVAALGHALNVVLGTALFAIKQISPAFIIGCAVAAALGYAFCVGLGTIYLRIAFARR